MKNQIFQSKKTKLTAATLAVVAAVAIGAPLASATGGPVKTPTTKAAAAKAAAAKPATKTTTTIATAPGIHVSNAYGRVIINADHFSKNADVRMIATFAESAQDTSVKTDANGNFLISIAAPSSGYRGDVVVTVVDKGQSVSTTKRIGYTASYKPTAQQRADAIEGAKRPTLRTAIVDGMYAAMITTAPASTPIEFVATFDDKEVKQTVTSNEKGLASVTIPIPAKYTGKMTMSASDDKDIFLITVDNMKIDYSATTAKKPAAKATAQTTAKAAKDVKKPNALEHS